MKYEEALNEYIEKNAGWWQSLKARIPSLLKRTPSVGAAVGKNLPVPAYGANWRFWQPPAPPKITYEAGIPGKVGGGLRTGQTGRKGGPYNPYKENVGPKEQPASPPASVADRLAIFKRHPLMTGSAAAYLAYMFGKNQNKKPQQASEYPVYQ